MNTAQFNATALTLALKTMFNKEKHFSICAFDRLAELAGVTVPNSERVALNALHCVSYADMPHGFKEQLAHKVVALLTAAPDYKLEIEIKSVQAPGFIVEERLLQ